MDDMKSISEKKEHFRELRKQIVIKFTIFLKKFISTEADNISKKSIQRIKYDKNLKVN
jgi:hypothetical protein